VRVLSWLTGFERRRRLAAVAVGFVLGQDLSCPAVGSPVYTCVRFVLGQGLSCAAVGSPVYTCVRFVLGQGLSCSAVGSPVYTCVRFVLGQGLSCSAMGSPVCVCDKHCCVWVFCGWRHRLGGAGTAHSIALGQRAASSVSSVTTPTCKGRMAAATRVGRALHMHCGDVTGMSTANTNSLSLHLANSAVLRSCWAQLHQAPLVPA
jgi:hypothetical protein